MAWNRYDLGDLITISLAFTDSANVPTDPSTITLQIGLYPSGPATTYTYGVGPDLVRDGPGAYHLDYLPASAGDYAYRGDGTGTVTQSAQGGFRVLPAVFG